jgi:hypothetical protein
MKRTNAKQKLQAEAGTKFPLLTSTGLAVWLAGWLLVGSRATQNTILPNSPNAIRSNVHPPSSIFKGY